MDLIVIRVSESFSDVWPALASRSELKLIELDDPTSPNVDSCVAVIIACGGAEEQAIEWLQRANRAGIDSPIVVGAEPDHRLAVELMRRGSASYYALPDDIDRLETEIQTRARLGTGSASDDLQELERRSFDFSRILGEDATLRKALDRVTRIIPDGRATVLVTGETGTGKELIAQAIHYNGPRAAQPFVTVNCSAVPAALLESEFFGHEQGAFTDARAAKPGLFEVADKGTIFLDEIATLPLELQGKLLRVLESGEVRRVGGVRTKVVDVRVIAAANVSLTQLVAEGAFREDLYYRLAVIPVHLPPLRERGGDVILLARHFLASITQQYGRDVPVLSAAAQEALTRHTWPGNVRELRNALERGLLLCSSGEIGPADLALAEGQLVAAGSAEPGRTGESTLPFPAPLRVIEVAAAHAAVDECGGNKSQAAKLLGIARARLYRLLEVRPEDKSDQRKPSDQR